MIRLVRGEFLKLRTTQVWFWLLLATAAVSALLIVAQLAPADGVRSAADVPNMFASSSEPYVLVFVLGVLGVTTEFRYQTITPTVLQTPSRWAIVGAKMITYALVGIAYALVAVAIQMAMAVPWLAAKGVHVDFGNGDVIRALAAVFGVVALFGIVGLGVGALLRNQIVAVVVGIVFLLVIQNVLVAIPGVKNVFPYTPGGAADAMLLTNVGPTDFNGVTLLAPLGGVIVLLLWAFVPAVVGAAYSMNRDIT
ncbi:MAG TPA: ABC transporter permease [Jatrophihabitans sp.]|nr:ABC transporter permease [Jatrophihabitans sp.]